MALSRVNRLRSRQDFNTVYRKGIRRKSSHLTLLALRQLQPQKQSLMSDRSESIAIAGQNATPLELQPTRIGISINLKVSKRAVIRNRIKRQLRSALRILLPRLARGWDLVVIVQPSATQCDYGQFLQELEQLLINAEVCDGH